MTTATTQPAVGLKPADFASGSEVRWCPGCGDYSILAIVKKTLAKVGAKKHDTVFISGIGCSSRFPSYVGTYGCHSIHGRAPTLATGLQLARPDLNVWIVTGDGDGLSIGGNHLIHVLRRNVDIKVLLFNNRIYGLTKGQYSPTSELSKKTKSTPFGSIDAPFNPLQLALGAGATFVARTIDVEPVHMRQVLARAAAHKGTAFVEILQNCNVFNDCAFEHITEKAVKDTAQLRLEHGKPLTFAKGTKGVKLNGFKAELATLGEGGVTEKDLLVHDEKADPSLSFLISELMAPNFPTPIGVFRSVERPTHGELDQAQTATAMKKGPGDLEKLLNSGDTWTVG
jgi:2-oxoglutarate/2-oxoacid ferredoxin oxidoreductase subunit beta